MKFLDSEDDLLLLTQEDRRNINDVPTDIESLMDSSLDSAVGSLASFDGKNTDLDPESEKELIDVAERYKPMVEGISDDEGLVFLL